MNSNWWKQVLLVGVTWLLSAAMNYGVIRAQLDELYRRVMTLEELQQSSVSRHEYDNSISDVRHQLELLNDKFDRYFLKGN